MARAIVTNPALILADEPTGNLDSRSTAEIMRVFDRLNRAGRTVALITHEPEVARHARRVIHLRDGRIVSDERPADLPAQRQQVDEAPSPRSRALRGGSR